MYDATVLTEHNVVATRSDQTSPLYKMFHLYAYSFYCARTSTTILLVLHLILSGERTDNNRPSTRERHTQRARDIPSHTWTLEIVCMWDVMCFTVIATGQADPLC